MSRLKIKIHDWSEIFMEIMPYLQNNELDRIIECMVDDVNGLMNESTRALNERGELDITAFSNTLNYIITNISEQINVNDVMAAICKCMQVIFINLSSYNKWVNSRFNLHSYRISSRDGSLNLTVNKINMFNYNRQFCEYLVNYCEHVLDNLINSSADGVL